jgi:predicted amidophosphoribosyltransferase
MSWLEGVPLIAAGRLEGTWQRAVHTFKYRGRPRLAAALVGPLQDALLSSDVRPGALTFIPLHPVRLRSRGFNQSERLARTLAERLRLPLCPALRRDRDTPPQVGLDESQRRRNVAGAFRWQAGTPPPPGLSLIDDVCTTGATLRSAAEAVSAAGGRVVAYLVLAVAPVQTLPGGLVTSWGRTGSAETPVQGEIN